MNESSMPVDELDALIEAALRDEPFLRAPLSLRRNVEARLRVVTLREHEQRRFSISMMTLVLMFSGSVLFAGALLWFTNLSVLYSEGVSGGKGWFDYYTTSLGLSFSSYQGAYSLIASFILAVATLCLVGVHKIHKFMHSE